jgi:hypothetical protein
MHFAPPSYGFPALNLEADRLKPVFKTVLIYENFAAGVRAQRFCERLARALDSTLEEQMWNFDVLGIREVRNGAAGAARSADAVILSVSGRTELPGTIRAWLDMWLGLLEKENPVLIALFESSGPRNIASIHAYLSGIARHAGIDFFPHHVGSPRLSRAAQESGALLNSQQINKWTPLHAFRVILASSVSAT